jgi:hypothetical protein
MDFIIIVYMMINVEDLELDQICLLSNNQTGKLVKKVDFPQGDGGVNVYYALHFEIDGKIQTAICCWDDKISLR